MVLFKLSIAFIVAAGAIAPVIALPVNVALEPNVFKRSFDYAGSKAYQKGSYNTM
jgi:hypothetical protein